MLLTQGDDNNWGFSDIALELDERDIVNRAVVGYTPYADGTPGSVVATLEEVVALASGETKEVYLGFSNPARSVTWVKGTDIKMNVQADGLGADISADLQISSMTSGQGVLLYLTNANAGTGYVHLCQILGTPMTAQDETKVEAVDAPSQYNYEPRRWDYTSAYLSETSARSLAEAVVGLRAEPRTMPVVTLEPVAPDLLVQMIARDVGSKIRLQCADAGFDAVCYVEKIRHTLDDTGDGIAHRTQWTLVRDAP